MDDIKDCPCANCQYSKNTIQENPCYKCADFNTKGYPEYKAIPGLLEPEKFTL